MIESGSIPADARIVVTLALAVNRRSHTSNLLHHPKIVRGPSTIMPFDHLHVELWSQYGVLTSWLFPSLPHLHQTSILLLVCVFLNLIHILPSETLCRTSDRSNTLSKLTLYVFLPLKRLHYTCAVKTANIGNDDVYCVLRCWDGLQKGLDGTKVSHTRYYCSWCSFVVHA